MGRRNTIEQFSVNGSDVFRSLDLDESEEEVKATAGAIFWIHAINTNAGARYLKLYDATAADVVVGTTVPKVTIRLQVSGVPQTLDVPIFFDTAITAAATTGIADNDTGAPGANEVIVHFGYV